MKKLASTLVALLLLVGILASCGSKTDPPPENPDDPGNESTGLNPSDNGSPINDPGVGSATGSIYDKNVAFLTQEESIYPSTSQQKPAISSLFPNAADIIAAGRDEVPLYGLYAWAHEMYACYDDFVKMGFSCLRTDMGHMNEDTMRAFCNSNTAVMCTAGNALCSSNDLSSSSDFFTGTTNEELSNINNFMVAEWVEKNINTILDFLKIWGPNGTFFERNPDVNYNPINSIEICNEPNFQYMLPIKRADGSDAANHIAKTKMYVLLQICVYHAVKTAYPNGEVNVVGFGAGGANGLDLQFIRDAISLTGDPELSTYLNNALSADTDSAKNVRKKMGLEDGEIVEINIRDTMDVLSTHPYVGTTSPFAYDTAGSGKTLVQSLNSIREILSNPDTGGTPEDAYIPIWYTECGWDISTDHGALYEGYHTGKTEMTQLAQAAMLVQNYIFGYRCNVDRITYMYLYDTDNCCYGILNYCSSTGGGDRSWRQAGYAIETLTTLMPNPRLLEVIQEGLVSGTSDYAYVYRFESDIGGEDVIVAFSALNATKINVPWEEDYALVTDMFGKTKIVAATRGFINLDGGACMMYIRHVDNETLILNGYIPSMEEGTGMTDYMWIQEREEL